MVFHRRQRKLNQIKEALTSRYQEFEEALHRRMMIRDMKVLSNSLPRSSRAGRRQDIVGVLHFSWRSFLFTREPKIIAI